MNLRDAYVVLFVVHEDRPLTLTFQSTRKRGKQKATNPDQPLDGHPSSDLEDCRDLWVEELGSYQRQTQTRMKQVSDWFEASVLVSETCYD